MAPDYLLQLARSDPESTYHRNQKVCQLIERLQVCAIAWQPVPTPQIGLCPTHRRCKQDRCIGLGITERNIDRISQASDEVGFRHVVNLLYLFVGEPRVSGEYQNTPGCCVGLSDVNRPHAFNDEAILVPE